MEASNDSLLRPLLIHVQNLQVITTAKRLSLTCGAVHRYSTRCNYTYQVLGRQQHNVTELREFACVGGQ